MKFTNKDYQWLLVFILVITLIIGMFCVVIANSKYSIRFEMDNNTLETVKSIDWKLINNQNSNKIEYNRTTTGLINATKGNYSYFVQNTNFTSARLTFTAPTYLGFYGSNREYLRITNPKNIQDVNITINKELCKEIKSNKSTVIYNCQGLI
jgi:archaellum component FlaG (FlaF/FlaG flagellin family)